jgi:tellurite resistance protein
MTGAVRPRIDASGQKRWIADVTVDGKRRQASGRTKAEAERRRLIEMAVRSEEAISKADVLSLSEARKRSKDLLKDIAAGRGKARPAAARRPTARKA